MGRSGIKTTNLSRSPLELACIVLVILLMVFSWFLTHGVTRGMYDQFAAMGDPPAAMGPVGETSRNQLGHWGYFWSERAFHYRTTLMFAVDDYTSPEVLEQDIAQQYPAGVNAWREYTLLMEPVYGRLFRWFGHQDEILAEFLTRLVPLVHVLMFLPLYLLARALGARQLLAASAVMVYATCSLGFSRFSGSLLLKENFALLWLMFFLAAHFWADRRRSFTLLTVAAVSLIILLASWHLSQFLVLVVLGAVAVAQSLGREKDVTWLILQPGAYLLAGALAGLTPSLLARGFFLSLTMMLILSWLVLAILTGRARQLNDSPTRRFGVLAGLFLVLGAASFLNRHFAGDYNHLFGLLVQKLVHGFNKPADPLLLPFDVRVFWASPFTTPDWSEVWSKLGYHVFILGPAMVAGVIFLFTGRLDRRQQSLLIMSPIFLMGWLMIERLGVILLPFAVVVLAVVAERVGTLLEDKRGWTRTHSRQVALAAVVLMIATPAANLAGSLKNQIKVARDVSKGRPVYIGASDEAYWGFRGDLLRWLVSNTPGPYSRFGSGQAQAVLGDIGVSPQVLLYTGRPVVLNSQFENQPIRNRYHDYLQALFSADPSQLQTILAEVEAGYLFINRNWATTDAAGSPAYLAGLTGPLSVNLNITRLHFAPQELGFLQPVYNNEFYRLFKVVPPAQRSPATWDRNHGNWWNLNRYTIDNGQLTNLADDRRRLQEFEDSLVALQEAQGRLLRVLEAGKPPGQPGLQELHQRYLEIKLQNLTGNPVPPRSKEVQQQLERITGAIQASLSRKDPQSGRPLGQALAMLYTQGLDGGQPGWRQLLKLDLAEPSHLAAAGQLAVMLGQYGEAADLMARAAAFFPLTATVAGDGQPGAVAAPLVQQIRQLAVWYHLAADRVASARTMAASYAPFSDPGSRSGKFFRQVAAIPEG